MEEQVKRCLHCGEEKPLSEFYKRNKTKDCFQSRCKKCDNEVSAERVKELRARDPEEVYKYITPESTLKCSKCKKVKRVGDFYKNMSYMSGFYPQCKNCYNGLGNAWKAASRNNSRINKNTAPFKAVKQMYDNNPYCTYCRRPLQEYEASIDHIVPLSTDLNDESLKSIDNLCISCIPCNLYKRDTPAEQFRTYLIQFCREVLEVYEANETAINGA